MIRKSFRVLKKYTDRNANVLSQRKLIRIKKMDLSERRDRVKKEMKLLLKDFRNNKLEAKVLEDETEELEDTDYCIIFYRES